MRCRSVGWWMVGYMAAALLLAGAGGCSTGSAPPAGLARGAAPPPAATPAPAPQAILPSSVPETPPLVQNRPQPTAPAARMTLLLPLGSATLGGAARAIRDGFMAGFAHEPEAVAVSIRDTGERPEDAVAYYQQALAASDIVIGPLQRQAVAAIVRSGHVDKPTLALNLPEGANGEPSEEALPANMLSMGLSVEEEARQVARWASSDYPNGTAYAVYGQTIWQRRAARAFAAQRLSLGLPTKLAEVSSTSGDARIGDLVKLQMRLQAEAPAAAPLLFVALDFDSAREVLAGLGQTVPAYGISQLNPNVAGSAPEPAPEMNGVRLLDIPWQVQTGQGALLAYPRPLPAGEGKPDPDLARLYALGVDGYRVARAIALKKETVFMLDGLSGKLSLRLEPGPGGFHFERLEVPVIYRDGLIRPLPAP
jgi:outer membrane PBP1 activator LpoA protein